MYENCSSFKLFKMFVCSVAVWCGSFARVLLFTTTSHHINTAIITIQHFVDLVRFVCDATCYCFLAIIQIIITNKTITRNASSCFSLMLTQLWNSNWLIENEVDLTNSMLN